MNPFTLGHQCLVETAAEISQSPLRVRCFRGPFVLFNTNDRMEMSETEV